MVHEQVQKQLEHLKSLVDGEAEEERRCKAWDVSYTPSRTKRDNIAQYEAYQKEIEKNGDKNLLVWVRLKGEDGLNMRGVYPFAKRYVEPNRQGEYYLTHRTSPGAEILCRDSQVEIVKDMPRLERTLSEASKRSEAARESVSETRGEVHLW